MSKIYASFSDPALAEKATGALLDFGVHTEDISLVRSGSEEDFQNWKSTGTDYETQGKGTLGYDRNLRGDPILEGGLINDTAEMSTSDRYASDTHYRAAEETRHDDYVDNRMEADRNLENKTDLSAKTGLSTTTPADAGAGAAKGAGIGLGIGILAALAAMFLPGIGFVVGGGALAVAIGGAVGTTGAGAIAGAVTGYLKDQGVEENLARDYEQTLTTGGALIEISLPSGDVDEFKAREVLTKYGASNVGAFAPKSYVS